MDRFSVKKPAELSLSVSEAPVTTGQHHDEFHQILNLRSKGLEQQHVHLYTLPPIGRTTY